MSSLNILVDDCRLNDGTEVRGVSKYLRAVVDVLREPPCVQIILESMGRPVHPSNVARTVRVRRRLRELGPRNTIYHAGTPFESVPFVGAQVSTVMDTIPLEVPGYLRFGVRTRLAYRTAAASKRILTLSCFSKSTIISRFQIPEETVVVAPLPPSRAFFEEPCSCDSCQANGIGFPYVLGFFDGRNDFDFRKRYEWYVPVARRLEDTEWRLVLIGPLGVSRRQASLAEAGALLVGALPECTLANLIRSAQAVIFPSAYEGQGMPALEALASETPVVAFDNTAISEVVRHFGILINESEPPHRAALGPHQPTDPGAITLGEVVRDIADGRIRPPRDFSGALKGFRPSDFQSTLLATYSQALSD